MNRATTWPADTLVSYSTRRMKSLLTYPQALEAQVRLGMEREGDTERQCEDVICHQIEESTEVLPA